MSPRFALTSVVASAALLAVLGSQPTRSVQAQESPPAPAPASPAVGVPANPDFTTGAILGPEIGPTMYGSEAEFVTFGTGR
jgi:hypothetical protein